MTRTSGSISGGTGAGKHRSGAALKSLSGLLNAVSDEFKTQREPETVNVALYYDRSCSHALRAYAQETFSSAGQTAFMHIEEYDDACCEVDGAADLTIIFAADSPWTGATATISKEKGVPTVVVTEDLAGAFDRAEQSGYALAAEDFVSFELAENEASFTAKLWNALADDPYRVDQPTGYDLLFEALGGWIVVHARASRFSLAAAFPFMRRAVALDTAKSCSYQNAAIALALFVPGADMPLMMANQARMVIQIGTAYGYHMSAEVAAELAVVVAGSFGARALARALAKAAPALGLASKAGVAFAGTYAMGYGTMCYCRAGKKVEVIEQAREALDRLAVRG